MKYALSKEISLVFALKNILRCYLQLFLRIFRDQVQKFKKKRNRKIYHLHGNQKDLI